MTHFILSLLIFLGPFSSQERPEQTVKVTYKKDMNVVTLMAENITEKNYKYTFNFALQNLKVIEGSEIIEIKAKDTVAFIRFEIIDAKRAWRYDFNYNYVRFYPEGAMAEIAKKLDIEEEVAAKSIIVFDKDGCTRCDRTLDFLKRKKIPHYVLNISEDKENSELMFGYVNDVGLVMGSITTPMVIIEEKAHFNIQNLDGFIQNLRKYRVKKSPD